MLNHGYTIQVGVTCFLVVAPNKKLAKKLALDVSSSTEKAVGVGRTDDLTGLRANGKEISLDEQAVYRYSALTRVAHTRRQ